ncbi:hypothetical protein [Acetobacter orientalis]|uniref:hypothetical protein n=1 Tax=Acetobacter orientalis TaxID=146474 RepID=UPI00241F5821|nr:hypothetical protein [Acetobacter orientalis]
MPYDSNGNYTLPPVYKAVAGTAIATQQHNTPLEDVQAALNQTLLRNGSVPIQNNWNMGSNRITFLADGVADTDAANVGQVKKSASDIKKDADETYAKITDPLIRSIAVQDSDYLIKDMAAHQTNGRLWFHYTDKDGKEQYPEAALASELTAGLGAKANLSGGNKFSGGQQVINVDNQGNPLLIETSNGQGFEFGIDQDTSFIDFHSVTAGNGADYDSRIIATGDITKGTTRLDFETNSLTWGGSPLALQSQLPFSDTGLKMQAFQVTGRGNTRVSFPTAFRSGTTPYVFLQINSEPNSQVSRYSPFLNSGSGNDPDVNNQNFEFSPVYTVSGGSGQSGGLYVLNVLAVGYF